MTENEEGMEVIEAGVRYIESRLIDEGKVEDGEERWDEGNEHLKM